MTTENKKPNLISISGRIGSGKDTVGDMIQYLTMRDLNEPCTIDYDEWCTPRGRNTGFLGRDYWQIKKFAGKLKDIVCLLIGCTREELEDSTFKNTLLPKEWTKYGIIRRDGSRVVEIQPTLKEAEDRLAIWEKGAWIKEMELTPRLLLQLLGTEAGRDIIHPNIWVNSLFADYRPLDDTQRASMGNVLDYSACPYPNWIITDLRFPNEKEAVERRGGITIRIARGVNDAGEHLSETALDQNQKWDFGILNNGSIEDLMEVVRGILIEAKIIK